MMDSSGDGEALNVTPHRVRTRRVYVEDDSFMSEGSPQQKSTSNNEKSKDIWLSSGEDDDNNDYDEDEVEQDPYARDDEAVEDNAIEDCEDEEEPEGESICYADEDVDDEDDGKEDAYQKDTFVVSDGSGEEESDGSYHDPEASSHHSQLETSDLQGGSEFATPEESFNASQADVIVIQDDSPDPTPVVKKRESKTRNSRSSQHLAQDTQKMPEEYPQDDDQPLRPLSGNTLLKMAESEEQRKLLMELYPELYADQSVAQAPLLRTPVTTKRKSKTPVVRSEKKQVPVSSTSSSSNPPKSHQKQKTKSTTPAPTVAPDVITLSSDDENDFKAPSAPVEKKKEEKVATTPARFKKFMNESSEKVPEETKVRPKRMPKIDWFVPDTPTAVAPKSKRVPTPENDGEDSFEKYLKKLKGESSQTESESDKEEIEDEDDEEKDVCYDDESFIVDDESLSEPSRSESEEAEESEGEKENEPKSDRKVLLLKSLKDSFNSPSLQRNGKKKVDDDEYFLMSLSDSYQGKRHPEAEKYVNRGIKGVKIRTELTEKLFEMFRKECFKDELPETMSISWNPRLRQTAGICRNKGDYTSRVELSPKVCTTPERLRDTLIHELCHAAVWMVDKRMKEHHGPVWKKWASQCMKRFRSLPFISVCHDYAIEAKFVYVCGGCGQKVKRHSKSLDITKKICGICKSHFTLTVNGKSKKNGEADGQEGVQKTPNKFALFVKEQYGAHKIPGAKHGDIMRILSAKFKQQSTMADMAITPSVRVPDPVEEAANSLDISIISIHD